VDGLDEKTDMALPLEGVKVIPMMGKEKLTTLAPDGVVSEMVMLSDALPLPPQLVVHLFSSPLHEFRTANATITNSIRNRFESMDTPRQDSSQLTSAAISWEAPKTL
jgi:hypothetical protein